MDVRISPHPLCGSVRALPSKSEAHRALILAALSSEVTVIRGVGTSSEWKGAAQNSESTAPDRESAAPNGEGTVAKSGSPNCGGGVLSDDILRTAEALCALGAGVEISSESITVTPCGRQEKNAVIDCGESGSTLRFMLPVCAALGGEFRFIRRGRLPKRPISVLTDQLAAHGLEFAEDGDDLLMRGRLTPGEFILPGNESSQYITGLLLALPLVGDSVLRVTGELESRPYVDITLDLMRKFGVLIPETRLAPSDNAAACNAPDGGVPLSEGGASATPVNGESVFEIGRAGYAPQGDITVGGDWSGSANMLCVGASVSGLDCRSCQGDRAILDILSRMGAKVCGNADGSLRLDMPQILSAVDVDMRDVPDLVPLVAVMCTAALGTSVIRNIRRLRLKESDRVEATLALIHALGGSASATENELFVEGCTLHAGEVDSFADHRIAMAAAVASCFADGDVTVRGAQCVAKSYPGFWDDLRFLGADVAAL